MSIITPAAKLLHTDTTTVVDWQTTEKQSTITVSPHSQLTYFLILGSRAKEERSLHIVLEDAVELKLYAVCIGASQDGIFSRVTVEHRGRGTKSRMNIKAVLGGSAFAKLDGLIYIPETGILTDAFLEERVLLLSDDARAQTVPQLEIKTNDVKATHAAAVSQLDSEQIFYLQSRGLERPAAQELIISSFLAANLQALPNDNVSATIIAVISEKIRLLLDHP